MLARVDRVLAGLDPQQRAAATLGPGPAQVIAPAGSGKTATLVARIGVLIAAGVPPARILVVTFNRDAAAELSRRVHSVLGLEPGGTDGPEVRTLHALARLVSMDAGHPARLVADRLPLLRHARRQVLAGLPPDASLPPAEELDSAVSTAILEGRSHPRPVSDVVGAYRGLLAMRGPSISMVSWPRPWLPCATTHGCEFAGRNASATSWWTSSRTWTPPRSSWCACWPSLSATCSWWVTTTSRCSELAHMDRAGAPRPRADLELRRRTEPPRPSVS